MWTGLRSWILNMGGKKFIPNLPDCLALTSTQDPSASAALWFCLCQPFRGQKSLHVISIQYSPYIIQSFLVILCGTIIFSRRDFFHNFADDGIFTVQSARMKRANFSKEKPNRWHWKEKVRGFVLVIFFFRKLNANWIFTVINEQFQKCFADKKMDVVVKSHRAVQTEKRKQCRPSWFDIH